MKTRATLIKLGNPRKSYSLRKNSVKTPYGTVGTITKRRSSGSFPESPKRSTRPVSVNEEAKTSLPTRRSTRNKPDSVKSAAKPITTQRGKRKLENEPEVVVESEKTTASSSTPKTAPKRRRADSASAASIDGKKEEKETKPPTKRSSRRTRRTPISGEEDADKTIEDPYELSADENDALAPSPSISSMPRENKTVATPTSKNDTAGHHDPDMVKLDHHPAVQPPVEKKRKFFTTTSGEGLAAKRSALSAFHLLKQKLCAGGKGSQAGKNTRQGRNRQHPPSKPPPRHRQPMTDLERARIAATTIWLPVPPTFHHNNNHDRPPHPVSRVAALQCFSTPVGSAPPAAGAAAILEAASGENGPGCSRNTQSLLMGNPVTGLPRISDLASPIVSCNTPVAMSMADEPEAGIFMDKGRDFNDAIFPQPLAAAEPERHLPFADLSNTPNKSSPRPPRQQSQLSPPLTGKPSIGLGNGGGKRRISFAHPLSPIHQRSPASLDSSKHSHSGQRGSHPSRDEDASNYVDWLEAFNAQLKPFEDFNLSVD